MAINCHFCDKEVDPKKVGNYRLVTGWTQLRKQGGTHSITLMEDPVAWAHSECIDIEKQRRKGEWQDTSLF